MTLADDTIRAGFDDVAKTTRQAYRYAWRVWSDYCKRYDTDPTKGTVELAQAWVDSMRLTPLSPAYIARHVAGARLCLELLAMMGHRPNEPFRYVVVPKVLTRGAKPAHGHEVLSDERIARALWETRNAPRAHGILWACAGMGLSSGELATMSHQDRIRRVGDTSVAVIQRGPRGHLIPVPRELLLVIDEIGWPMKAKSQVSVKGLVARVLQPSISTSCKDLRDFHRDCAIRLGMDPAVVHACLNDGAVSVPDARNRFHFSEHSSIIVCAHLRNLLLDRIAT